MDNTFILEDFSMAFLRYHEAVLMGRDIENTKGVLDEELKSLKLYYPKLHHLYKAHLQTGEKKYKTVEQKIKNLLNVFMPVFSSWINSNSESFKKWIKTLSEREKHKLFLGFILQMDKIVSNIKKLKKTELFAMFNELELHFNKLFLIASYLLGSGKVIKYSELLNKLSYGIKEDNFMLVNTTFHRMRRSLFTDKLRLQHQLLC